MLRYAPVILLAVAAGCFGPKLGEDPYICGADMLCPPGYTCEQPFSACTRGPGGADDAGLSDAGPPDAAGRADGRPQPDAMPCTSDCALGCCEGHCCDLSPSNADRLGILERTGLEIAPPPGSFDTLSDCATPSTLGNCELVPLDELPDVCVCRFDRGIIGDLRVTGPHALALFARETVDITGQVEVFAILSADGPGAAYYYGQATNGEEGGAGGSFGTKGGNLAVTTVGKPELVPLIGGMSGQDSCNGAHGGGGGGALQVSAGVSINVTGSINAAGGGGSGGVGSGSVCLGGGGGGSGGGILVEAPAVSVIGVLAANGGGGGGGGSNRHEGGAPGLDGATGAAHAPGGQGADGYGCVLGDETSGGDGGEGAAGGTDGRDGQGSDFKDCLTVNEYLGAGGGGGGEGRIRVNSQAGCGCADLSSPKASEGTINLR